MGLDFLCAVRALARARQYTFGVVAVIAPSVAINLAVFAIAAPALVAPLPFARSPQQLVAIREVPPRGGAPASVAPEDYALLRALRTIPQVAAYASGPEVAFTLLHHGPAQRLPGAIVSGDFFSVLQAAPLLGRTLLPADDLEQAVNTVVLSHRLWASRFGSDKGVVGRHAILSGKDYTIVGVMPASFDFPAGAQVWISKLKVAYKALNSSDIAVPSYGVIGRLAGGADPRTAQAELATLQPAGTSGSGHYRFVELGLREAIYAPARRPLELVWLVAGCFLLLACANLASLAIARWWPRQSEVALRAALGAGPAAARRSAVLEALMLSCAGATLGALLGIWLARWLGTVAPPGTPAPRITGGDWVGLALIFGLASAISLSPVFASRRSRLAQPAPSLRNRRGSSVLLVAGQLAVTTVLLALAMAATSEFFNALRIHTGISTPPSNLLLADVSLPANLYPDNAAKQNVLDRLVRAARALPGVSGAAWVSQAPLRDGASELPISVRVGGTEPVHLVNCFAVSPAYPEVVGLRLLAGRDFSTRAGAGVLVGRQAAREFWPGQPAVGQWISFGPPYSAQSRWLRVIGVVQSVATHEPHETRLPQVYALFSDIPAPYFSRTLVVRTPRPQRTALELRALAAGIAPDVPLERLETMGSILRTRGAPVRFPMLALGAVAALGLALAGFGVYAFAARVFQQREFELAVRFSLGATPAQIRALVHRTALRWALWGEPIGILGLWLLSPAVGRLVGVAGSSFALASAAAAAIVGMAVAAAAYRVARRASAIAPARVLRAE